MTKKLFAVYLGGRADHCNIELHDVVFVVGSTLEETYPSLVHKWFGNQRWFHIDSFIELTQVDGFDIHLMQTPCENTSTLFFINFGGYQPGLFGEIHQTAFYVVKDKAEAIRRAQKELCSQLLQPHCDDALSLNNLISSADIDDVIQISEVDQYYIQLIPTSHHKTLEPQPGYRKIEVKNL